jgi:hypothetical protein
MWLLCIVAAESCDGGIKVAGESGRLSFIFVLNIDLTLGVTAGAASLQAQMLTGRVCAPHHSFTSITEGRSYSRSERSQSAGAPRADMRYH